MVRTIRPMALAAAFGVLFVIIAGVSWSFASGLADPWYPADLSRWVYTTNMLVAAVFLAALGGLGLSIRKSFNRQMRDLAKREGTGAEGLSDALPPPLPETGNLPDRVDRDIDDLLQSLSEIEAKSAEEAEAMEIAADTLPVQTPEPGMPSEEPSAAQRLRERHKALGRYLLGPGLVAAAILGLSGMMLPGSDGFAQTNYQINTALILGIGYSWGGLGAYVASTIYALVAPRGRSAPGTTN